jgi:hypothetical protein
MQPKATTQNCSKAAGPLSLRNILVSGIEIRFCTQEKSPCIADKANVALMSNAIKSLKIREKGKQRMHTSLKTNRPEKKC